MVKVAVIDVPLTTVVLLTVMPVPLRPIVAPDAKFVPVSVTGTVCPCVPELGLTELSVGAPAPEFTVNVCEPLVLPELVTVTFCAPVGAFEAMVNVAVIDVPLATVVLLTAMPVPLKPIVAPDAKFVPVSVTPTVCPCVPELGLTELSVGAPALEFTVNVCEPLVLPELVTVTVWAPVGAFKAMVNVAVIDVPPTTVVLLTVMPVPLRPIVAPDAKFVPVSVTGTVCPCVPELGLTELSVGAPAPEFTVNVCEPLVLPELVTVTFCAPVGAFEAMVNVAVIDVPLATVVLLTAMPVPLKPIVAPDAKFVPVSVTPTVCPCVPELGLTELSVGAPALEFTVNVCEPLVLPELVTVTVWAPVGAFKAMVNVAVIDVPPTTVVLLTVMPVPLRPIVAPDAKFVPVSVTGTVCPCVPELGLTELSVGAPAPEFTVNVCEPLVLPELVTVTFCAPVGAFEAMVNVAVIDVPLATVVLLTAMPVPLKPIVAPDAKFVPVSVTPTVCPCVPELGLTELSVGAPALEFTVNVCEPLVLPELVTVTFWAPVGAFKAMVNVAVIDVPPTTVVLLTVMPVPLRPIVAPDAKFVPVSVTGTVCPCVPELGLTELSVGAPAPEFTVNVCEPLVLPELVTVTFCAPVGAFEAMVNVAVIDVPLTTVVLLTVMPVPLRPIVAPDAKFVPVSVTPTVCPCVPELGLTELSVGAPKFTVNVCVPLVLPELVTATFWAPVGAFEAMVNVAVIDVPLTTVVLLTVMPVPLRPIVAP